MTPRKPRASIGSSSGPQGSHKNLSTSLDAFEDCERSSGLSIKHQQLTILSPKEA